MVDHRRDRDGDRAVVPGRRRSSAAFGRNTRPPRTYTTGHATNWIRHITLVTAAVITVGLLVRYPSLPEKIPIHFGFSGQPDAWGPKTSVFMLVGIFTVMIGGITWLSHYPRSFNYIGEFTEENAQAMYRAGEQLIVWVNAACALIYLGIALMVAVSPNDAFFVALGLIAIVTAMIAGIARMLRASSRGA